MISSKFQMKIIKGDSLKCCFDHQSLLYDSDEFHKIHHHKAEDIYRVIVHDKIPLISIVIGLKKENYFSPYSSPFTTIKYNSEINEQQFSEAIDFLIKNLKLNNLTITIAPRFYFKKFYEILVSKLNQNCTKCVIDFNNHFELQGFELNKYLKSRSNRNYIKAKNKGLKFLYNIEDVSLKECYSIIKKNRDENGYPLKMNLDDIKKITLITDVKWFAIEDNQNNKIAAAICFLVEKDIYQIIYWGDIKKYRFLRPMDFLAAEILNFFNNQGIGFVDIGPSSSNGIPDNGLLSFKKRLGCKTTSKFTFKFH